MRLQPPRFGLACAALILCAGAAGADTIYLLDGRSLTGVEVKEENIKEIAYKEGAKKGSVRTDEVLRIEFSGKSPGVDRADLSAADGQTLDAISDLEVYVDGYISGGKRTPRYTWEPAYAMHRLIELNGVVGQNAELIAAADKLIEHAPESRFVPGAYLAKAEAQHASGNSAAAQKTLKDFLAKIQSKALSQRWLIEQKLASALFDSTLQGKKLRDELDKISNQAGSQFPQVYNRAEVAIAESLMASKQFAEAEPIFAEITENAKAEPRTLAAAYTGLGDCLFKRGADVKDGTQREKLLVAAITAYMRVVVVYKDQTQYVPKAMFWAGRVFDELGGDENKEKAQKLYRKVMIEYRGSAWADEANAFRKR
jgi:tetratricopeptide (TPR) repeat protein